MRSTTLVALCWFTFLGCADAQEPTGAEGSDTVVIVDGRAFDEPQDASAWESAPAVRQAIRDARAYWSERDPGYEEEVRVLAVADGAFTAAGAVEHAVLYLMARWPRCCPKVGIAIVGSTGPGQGGPLIRNVAFESPTHGVRTAPGFGGGDVDGLALLSAFGMGGSEERSVQLATVGEGPVEIRASHALYSGSCGAMRDGEEAYRISAHLGDAPGLTAERFVRATCEGGTWEPSGDPQPLELAAPDGSIFTDLPVD